MLHIYRQITALERFRPIVIAQKRDLVARPALGARLEPQGRGPVDPYREPHAVVFRGEDLRKHAAGLDLEALGGRGAARLRRHAVEVESPRRHVEEVAHDEEDDEDLGNDKQDTEAAFVITASGDPLVQRV